MKALGGGAAGLGALSMLPSVSGFKITSGNPLQYFNQSASNSSFEVSQTGTLTANQVGTSSNPIGSSHFQSLDAEKANIERYGERIQLSKYATDGSGTDADPYILDIADVTGDSDVTQQTDLVVDGIFEIDKQQDIPAQYQLVGGAGRDDNDRGSVIRAATGFSDARMIDFNDAENTLAKRNGGGAIGVYFDANGEADQILQTSSGARNRWFYRCSFRNANGDALEIRNRKVSFVDCDIGDQLNSGSALGVSILTPRQCSFTRCRFASNDKNVEVVIDTGLMELVFDDCTFTNHHFNPSFQIFDSADGSVDPEAILDIKHCRWTDFGAAVNAIKIGQGNAAEVAIPMHFSHLYFDGTERGGSATGNKAINFPNGTAPNGIYAHDLQTKNFTNTPVIDFGADPANVRFNGTVEMSSSPSASNWDSADSGVTILDTSETPPDKYYVRQDGSLDGPYAHVNESYTTSNVTTSRSLDADNATDAERGDVLATLIEDLKTAGVID